MITTTEKIDGQDVSIQQGYGTWADFCENFTKAFITSDVEGEALHDLKKLRQGRDKGVESYIQ